MFPFPITIVSGKAISNSAYVTTSEDLSSGTSFTHSGVSIGEADPTRLIVVTSATYSVTPAITGITIDGNSMTKAVNNISSSGLTDVAIFYYALAAGTTADFVVTKAGSNSNYNHLSVYVLYDLSSTTPYVTATSDADPADLSSNVTANSFGIAVAQTIGGAYSITETGVTENYETSNWGSNAKTISSASQLFSSTESPRTITMDYSVALHHAGAFAAWS